MIIHPAFWVAMVAWGAGITLGEPHAACVLYFALAAFVSLLVHEWGHAVAGRALVGGEVGVYLSWLGGACCSEKEPRCSLRQGICITLAGPLVGLLVAACVCGWLVAEAQSVGEAAEMAGVMLRGEAPAELVGRRPGLLLMGAVYLLQISVLWSGLNLLPIYPLDGGLLVHELMGPTHMAHIISLGTTCILSLLFVALGVWALAALMLALSYYNYRCILMHQE